MKNILLLFLLFITCLKISAQTETKYLDNNYEKCKKKNAVYIMEITERTDSVIKKIKYYESGKLVVIYKHHKANDKVVYAYNYSSFSFLENEGLFINSKKEGEWKYFDTKGNINKIIIYSNDSMITERYYSNGLLALEIPYRNGRYNGNVNIYTKVGTIARKVKFENGYQINKEDLILYDSLNKDATEKIITECMPSFVGGEQAMMRYITEKIVYPKQAISNAVSGRVVVKFTLDKSGNVKDPIIISKNKLGYGCEEEAMRVIKQMPRWNPGLQNGIPVPVYFNLPVSFRLF